MIKPIGFKLSAFIFLSLFFIGCQKEIQLDLREAATQYVLEGSLDDSTGFKLRITQSKPFYDDNTFNPISSAVVEVSDNLGNVSLIPYDTNGFYLDSTIKAISGRTYTVKVVDNGKEFKCTSIAQPKTPIKKVTIGSFNFGGGPDGPGLVRFLQVWYDEHPGQGNHYRLVYNNPKDSESLSKINLQDDRFGDGIETQILVFGGRENGDGNLEIGDTVYVSLQTIDKACYDYFYTLDQITGGGRGASVTPSDPISNWDNQALGVFTLATSSSKRVIIDK